MKRGLLFIPFGIALCIYIISFFNVQGYSKSIHTQIALIHGELIWIGPNPNSFRYPIIRAVIGTLVFAAAVMSFRWLCTSAGLAFIVVATTVGLMLWGQDACCCPVLGFDVLLWAAWYKQWRKRQEMIKANRCIFCGYDLRATPTRCPECGNEVANRQHREDRRVDDLPK